MIQQEKRTCVKVAHRGPVVLGKRCTLNYEKRPLNAATRSQRVLSRTVAPRWGAEGRTQSSASREGSAVSARRATCPWAEHGEGTHAADVQALCGPAGAEGPRGRRVSTGRRGGPRFLRPRPLCAPRTGPLQPAPAPWATRPVRQPCRGPQGLRAVSRHPGATHAPDQRPPGAQEATHARDKRPPRLSSGPCAAFSTGRVVVA